VRIGELARRTGTTPRLLRYYEEQGLVSPTREQNGYRDYDERLVARVEQIRGLLAAGMSTRLIHLILPCLNRPDSILVEGVAPSTIALLEEERARMDSRIECLLKNRDAISRYLDAVTAVTAVTAEGRPAATAERAEATALAPVD
jgi:DNA-binding transcriptional MerR regulator